MEGNVSVYACACRLWEGRQQRSRLRGRHVSMARQKTWVVMVATEHRSRESPGVGVLAVLSGVTWESEGESVFLAATEDLANSVK
jgi:hypothetical protein